MCSSYKWQYRKNRRATATMITDTDQPKMDPYNRPLSVIHGFDGYGTLQMHDGPPADGKSARNRPY